MPAEEKDEEALRSLDFIRQIVADDVAAGKHGGRVQTRFPPEPNGYLHIGHAKSICLNFGIAREFGGLCNLRFDDTNPVVEEEEYVKAIQEDIRWLGFDWDDRLFYASDYFETLHGYAVDLIRQGKAYVDSQSPEEIRETRGSLTRPGTPSPFRDRTVEENLDLFARMREGKMEEGSCVLRAKIDMASPNMNLRDPVLYRIKKATHHRTGDTWCIYPTYDFAHGYSDSIEGITHSLCTLEFENHRPLYDWLLQQLPIHQPRQIEFARLNLTHTVMSKRKLLELVKDGHVSGWDDPRLPTLRGMRRRGYPPEALRRFCEIIGVTKFDGVTDIALLEHVIREQLNEETPRRLAVLDPLKVILTNYPEGEHEELECINNPQNPDAGTRKVPFSRELYIERSDFLEAPPKKFFRLAPGREVRLRYAYFITCQNVVKDSSGNVVALECTYDPATRGGDAPDGRKVKGTIHWVDATASVEAEVRLFEHLFAAEKPEEVPDGGDWKDNLNPASLVVRHGCRLEPSLADLAAGERVQFERLGYFTPDPVDSRPDRLVFLRTVALKDKWARMQKKGGRG
ncbi:MAG TPA: glutamine--tRNA ligase/YqeY domain fusion protein [Planctomycetes bacterium]|nr:glutamine--tRNA ligase/YqeY domain fusion protein [Planctomycetota bacterium]